MYSFLCDLGYEMSDEEKSLQVGTHDLFSTDEELFREDAQLQKYKHTSEELKALQNLPLNAKIARTLFLIKEFYDHHKGGVYVAFSGGKDSTVLLDLCRRLYPEITTVFCNTGLEYPENCAFVKTIDNVTVVKPKISFTEVLGLYGYPVISKEVAKIIRRARRGIPRAVNALEGKYADGTPCRFNERNKK